MRVDGNLSEAVRSSNERSLPPVRDLAGAIHGGDAHFDLLFGGVDDPGGSVGHLHEFAGLHFVVPLFVHGGAGVGTHEAGGFGFFLFLHLGDELRDGLGALGIRLAEGDAGTAVQRQHLRLLFSKNGEEGGIALHAEDQAAIGGAQSVDDVVIGDTRPR